MNDTSLITSFKMRFGTDTQFNMSIITLKLSIKYTSHIINLGWDTVQVFNSWTWIKGKKKFLEKLKIDPAQISICIVYNSTGMVKFLIANNNRFVSMSKRKHQSGMGETSER